MKQSKALSIVLSARNELLKLNHNQLIDAIEETTATLPTNWIIDIVSIKWRKSFIEWTELDGDSVTYEDLRQMIAKEEAKAKKPEKKADAVTSKSKPAEKPKKAESKPKAEKKAESKPKAKKEAEKPKKAESKPSDKVLKLAKDIKKRFKPAEIAKTNTDILAIAYTLDCSVKDAKKKQPSDYYKKQADKVKFNLSTLAIDYLKQTA